jgi:large subunit ribosomal protein L19
MSEEEKKDTLAETEETPKAETAPETPAEEKVEEAPKEEAPAAEAEAPVKTPSEEPVTETASEVPAEEPADVLEEEEIEPPKDFKTKLVGFDDLRPGMTVRLHERIKDISPKGEERSRIQVFEGMILGLRGAGVSRTLTIRKVSKGYGVEKIYPINSPVIDKIELVKVAKVRRAKLSYLKNLKRRFKRKLKEEWMTK